jgi:hypothetical protein
MTANHSSLQTASIFLSRFYHEEPNDDLANLKAIEAMCGLFDYEWQVSSAFKDVFATAWPAGTLKNMVRVWANRHAQSDKEAVQFLRRVYENTALDVAINLDDFTDDVSAKRGAKGAGTPNLSSNRRPLRPQLTVPVGSYN